MEERYLEPHQALKATPSPYENLLGDSIERAFAADAADLQALSVYLNEHGPEPRTGLAWTPEVLSAELARLAGD